MEINSRITSKLSEYITPISELIDFEVYIVNKDLLRICGTGMYSKMLGIRLPDNTSNGWVINNVKPLEMFTPMEHDICDECPMKKSSNCAKEYSIHQPIMINDNCFGVVTISSLYNETSKSKLLKEKDKLMKYLKVMSSQISSIIELDMMELQYKSLLSHTNEAFVVTDEDGEILEKSRSIGSKLSSIKNIYNIIPKDAFSYVSNEKEVSFEVGEDLSVRRIRIDVSKVRYHQLFFISRIQQSQDSMPEDEKLLIDEELFLSQMVGGSESTKKLKSVVRHVAKFDSNCLILGESGTGKEMIAELIHKLSNRRDKPFIPINCAAIPDNLVESEIFGYESGSFTGASKKGKKGLFEAANNGTVFLDEIGDMPIYLQPKLLRVIETRKVTRVGGTDEIQLDVRIIAATNKHITEQIKNGDFREDLYYRLNVIPLKLESLRDRSEDVLELTRHFLKKYNSKFDKSIEGLSPDFKKRLLLHDWPGNVRELENVIEYAITMEKTSLLTAQSLPENFKNETVRDPEELTKLSIADFREQNIRRLIIKHGQSVEGKSEVAKELGVSLSTLYRYISKYNISQ